MRLQKPSDRTNEGIRWFGGRRITVYGTVKFYRLCYCNLIKYHFKINNLIIYHAINLVTIVFTRSDYDRRRSMKTQGRDLIDFTSLRVQFELQ